MEIPDSYQPCIAEAQRAATEGEWDRVGELMGALCERAIRDGDRAMAGSAAVSEADALRRAERPGEATRAIRRALDLVDDPETRALQELQFIAVLLDTGRLDIAEQIGRERVAACPPGPYRTLALDSLCGVLLSRGDVAGLASLVVQLEGEAEGPMSVAARFRRAQLDRLGGRLEDAAEGFGDCMASLDHRPGALGAWAAACSGLAGVALLKGDVPDALSLYDRAADAWARAGRRSGEWRVLSGRARASLRLGASTFLPNLLDSGVRYARERHLMLLEVELLTLPALRGPDRPGPGGSGDRAQARGRLRRPPAGRPHPLRAAPCRGRRSRGPAPGGAGADRGPALVREGDDGPRWAHRGPRRGRGAGRGGGLSLHRHGHERRR